MAAACYQQDESNGPYVEIIEQPCKAIRFRYESDKTVTTIPGVTSVKEKKTYPTIKIHNHTGQATIIVSCVTKDDPHRAHPHYLVGKEPCLNGVWVAQHIVTEQPKSKEYQLKHVGVQCARKWDVLESLKSREQMFQKWEIVTDFSHKKDYQNIDLSVVRLCFQVLITDKDGRHCLLPPVFTNAIYDNKSNLLISYVSPESGPVKGGTEIVVLCGKVTKNDTKVVFYLEDDEKNVVWRENAETIHFHKGAAIVFKTPGFKDLNIRKNVSVQFRLESASLETHGNPCSFEYIADYTVSRYERKSISELLGLYSVDKQPSYAQPQNNQNPFTVYKQENVEMRRASSESNGEEMWSSEPNLQLAHEYVQNAQLTPQHLLEEAQDVQNMRFVRDERILQQTHGVEQTSDTQWPLQGNKIPQTNYNPFTQLNLKISIPNPIHQSIPERAASVQPLTPVRQFSPVTPTTEATYMQQMSSMQDVTAMQQMTPTSVQQLSLAMPAIQQVTSIQTASQQLHQTVNTQWLSPCDETPCGPYYSMWGVCSPNQNIQNQTHLNDFPPNYKHMLSNTMRETPEMPIQPTTSTQANDIKMETDSSGSLTTSKLLNCSGEVQSAEMDNLSDLLDLLLTNEKDPYFYEPGDSSDL